MFALYHSGTEDVTLGFAERRAGREAARRSAGGEATRIMRLVGPDQRGEQIVAGPVDEPILANADLSTATLTGADLSSSDLRNARLVDATLAGANLSQTNLTNAKIQNATLTRVNLSQSNLTVAKLNGANLTGANLSEAILMNAIVTNAKLSSTGITLDQLYSTASYQAHDLTGVHLVGNDLTGANLAGQNLTSSSFYAAKLVGADFTNGNLTNAEFVNADLSQANLTGANLTNGTVALANLTGANLTGANLSGTNFIGANLTGADIGGASLSRIVTTIAVGTDGRPCGCSPINWWPTPFPSPSPTTYIAGTGVTLAQLVSTASYGAGDLSDVTLLNSNFNGGNFAGFNLTNANFNGTTLVGAEFSAADARGAIGLSGVAAPNFVRPDGHIAGLNLSAGQMLSIRDYDGTGSSGIPIQVDQQLTMAPDSTLQMILEADDWGSTVSFAAGIPVTLGGKLELAFADGASLASQIGRTFDLFDWTGVVPTGSFAIGSPYVWDLTNLYTTGEVTFLSAGGLVGDFNNDGTVDSADYVVWRKGLGTGYADAAYNVWRANFGATLGAGSSSIRFAESSAVPEPNAAFLLTCSLVAASMVRRRRHPRILAPLLALLFFPCSRSLAELPEIELTQIGAPIWKPVDFQLFSAPAAPFQTEFNHVYDVLVPIDIPSAPTYTPHAPPYDTEISSGALAGGYVSQSVFQPDAITLDPNGVYFAFMFVPDPGITGSSRDFASGPVIPNSLFPIASNVDVWLDGVLVDRAPGADAIIPVQPRDVGKNGTSHLESIVAIWHPWDDDLTVGPLGNYDLRVSLRDSGGSGWDIVAPFKVVANLLPGDFNNDNVVDAADYVVWRKNAGTQAEHDLWRANFGRMAGIGAAQPSASPLSGAVPEPSAAALAVCGVLGFVGISRQTRAALAEMASAVRSAIAK